MATINLSSGFRIFARSYVDKPSELFAINKNYVQSVESLRDKPYTKICVQGQNYIVDGTFNEIMEALDMYEY